MREYNTEISNDFWVGGTWACPNSSMGYHGLLQQFWESCEYVEAVLIVSEGTLSKGHFQSVYPHWHVENLNYGDADADFNVDLCCVGAIPQERYDLIICQATLEHVYSPFCAMRNMAQGLSNGGALLIHTHPPSTDAVYHPCPADFFRFYADWFYDIAGRLSLTLKNIYETTAPSHIFAYYEKHEIPCQQS